MQFEIRRKPLGRNLTLEVDSGLRLDSSIHDTCTFPRLGHLHVALELVAHSTTDKLYLHISVALHVWSLDHLPLTHELKITPEANVLQAGKSVLLVYIAESEGRDYTYRSRRCLHCSCYQQQRR
jgi:hypothetical protein